MHGCALYVKDAPRFALGFAGVGAGPRQTCSPCQVPQAHIALARRCRAAHVCATEKDTVPYLDQVGAVLQEPIRLKRNADQRPHVAMANTCHHQTTALGRMGPRGSPSGYEGAGGRLDDWARVSWHWSLRTETIRGDCVPRPFAYAAIACKQECSWFPAATQIPRRDGDSPARRRISVATNFFRRAGESASRRTFPGVDGPGGPGPRSGPRGPELIPGPRGPRPAPGWGKKIEPSLCRKVQLSKQIPWCYELGNLYSPCARAGVKSFFHPWCQYKASSTPGVTSFFHPWC